MDRQSTMRSSRDVVQTSLLQLLNLVIDTCRVKGHIWTQQHYIQWSIVKSHGLLSLLFHTLMMVRLSYSTLTRWFTHLTSWFKHQISTIGHHTLSQNCPDWLCSKSPTDASSILAQGQWTYSMHSRPSSERHCWPEAAVLITQIRTGDVSLMWIMVKTTMVIFSYT